MFIDLRINYDLQIADGSPLLQYSDGWAHVIGLANFKRPNESLHISL
jgi:hypothetical protein